MKNILVLCTGNSCRSQIAHGFLASMTAGKANIYSAGVETHGVNPKAISTMQEIGIDISHHTSNNITEYLGVFRPLLRLSFSLHSPPFLENQSYLEYHHS